MRKYIPHVLVGVLTAAILFLGFVIFELKSDLSASRSALEAQQGQITGQKHELQRANAKLGLAESDLVSKDSIIERYKKDVQDLNIEITKLKGKKPPKPTSVDGATIVINGGTAGIGVVTPVPGSESPTTSVASPTLSYLWSDASGRFKLEDPDIQNPGDEKFTYRLKIRVSGYILEDETGKIRGRQVIARELVEVKNPDGTTSTQEGPPLPIEDNIYQYSLPKPEKKLFDIFKMRGYALFDTSLNPGIGLEVLNMGRYFDYVNVGVGPFVAVNISSAPESIQSSLLGLGLQYTLAPPAISTNIGLGLGISTPADNLFGRFQVTGNIIFYLTN